MTSITRNRPTKARPLSTPCRQALSRRTHGQELAIAPTRISAQRGGGRTGGGGRIGDAFGRPAGICGAVGAGSRSTGGAAGSGTGTGNAIGPATVSPTRNGRRSLLAEIQHADNARRQREDDVGFLSLALRLRKQPADDREVAQAGDCPAAPPLFVADQPCQQIRLAVLADGSTVLISRLPNVGSPPNPAPEMLLTAIFSASDTSSS